MTGRVIDAASDCGYAALADYAGTLPADRASGTAPPDDLGQDHVRLEFRPFC